MLVTGIFQDMSPSEPNEPAHTPRPFVPFEVNMSLDRDDQRATTEALFLVDTGADATLLAPVDAYELLGDALFEIDFDDEAEVRWLAGIGGYARSVTRSAILSTVSDDGEFIGMFAPIRIAEPVPRIPTQEHPGNWGTPSLLGRDILRYFEIHLDYFPDPVIALRFDKAAQQHYETMAKPTRIAWADYLHHRSTTRRGRPHL